MKKYSRYKNGTILKDIAGFYWKVERFYLNKKKPVESYYSIIPIYPDKHLCPNKFESVYTMRLFYKESTKAERILFLTDL